MHIRKLEVTQLRLLEALASHGNISDAAEAVELSQSAASHSLARLRTLLDDPLFVRTSRGMEPTPYGSKVCAAVSVALIALRDGIKPLEPFDPAHSKRTFKLYVSDIGQTVFLPRLLSKLQDVAPSVTINIRPVPLRDQEAALESGEIDLAVGHFTSLVAGFYQRRLFRERYVCVARVAHPRFADGMSKEAYVQTQHAIADASGMSHELLEQALRKRQLTRNIALRVPQFMVLPFIIESSDLVVTMPSLLAEQFAKLIRIQVMPLPARIPTYDIKLFWHHRVHNDEANQWLRRLFVELFGDSTYTDRGDAMADEPVAGSTLLDAKAE